MYACVGRLCLSAWDVTKHGSRSPSPMGINWVSDGVSIDSTEYMCCKVVCFSGSFRASYYSRLLRKKQDNSSGN